MAYRFTSQEKPSGIRTGTQAASPLPAKCKRTEGRICISQGSDGYYPRGDHSSLWRALAPTESVSENYNQPTPIEKEKKLTKVFKDIRDYILNKLEKTTIADAIK